MGARYELPCLEGKAAFIDPEFAPVGGSAHSVVLELRLAGVDARLPLSTYTDGGHTIVDFFNELAADWDGWDGDHTWYDDPVRFLLVARHDGRRQVEFCFRGRSDMAATLDDGVAGPGHWLVEGSVSVAVGALAEIPVQLGSLLVT